VGVDYWWFGCFIDERKHDQIQPHFAAAAANAVLSQQSRQAIAAWRACPSDFEQEAFITRPEVADQTNAFIAAFNLAGFVALTRQILTQEGRLADILAEQSSFRMAITARHTPVSIVWHALGYERASRLPCQMGNLLLRPSEVEEALEKTRRAYAGTAPSDLLEAGRRYCSTSVGDDALHETLDFQPDGLAEALKRKCGFLALTCPRI
jgi:hypothetical protein